MLRIGSTRIKAPTGFLNSLSSDFAAMKKSVSVAERHVEEIKSYFLRVVEQVFVFLLVSKKYHRCM